MRMLKIDIIGILLVALRKIAAETFDANARNIALDAIKRAGY
jgi:hypothetical protein